VRSTAAPYTESRLTHLVRNKCVGFPVVEQVQCLKKTIRNPNQNRAALWLESFLYEAAQNFELFSNIQDQNLKNKNI
jgi:hypothetical protein